MCIDTQMGPCKVRNEVEKRNLAKQIETKTKQNESNRKEMKRIEIKRKM